MNKNIKELLEHVYLSDSTDVDDIVDLLSVENEDINILYEYADNVRKKHVGDGIFLRGIIEFSNYCRNTCAYCGLNKNNSSIHRYRLKEEEVLASVELIVKQNVKTIVLQSGEEDELDPLWMESIISKIKSKYNDIAITLSIGEREKQDYEKWRKKGADRFLLKLETTDELLYNKLHPNMDFKNRIKCLNILKELGYQTGTGNIIGLKGQDIKQIAKDLIFFKKYNFDMISISPFLPHNCTDLADEPMACVSLVLKTIAVARILSRNAHIPATTALGSMGKDYRLDALKCGANVIMPNYTPQPYRKLYEIYPGKRCIDEAVGLCAGCMKKMAESIGRYIDESRGDSFKITNN